MADRNAINQLVRQNMRRLRLSKKMKLRQIADRARIPLSSYACMESGHYKISLDHLFQILGALDADIREVWPVETTVLQTVEDDLYKERIQAYRLGEIISLSSAEGAALFRLNNRECKLLLEAKLNDTLLERLGIYLEDGRRYPKGLWFERTSVHGSFHFFLKTEQCPDYVRSMIRRYLVIWSHVFENSR